MAIACKNLARFDALPSFIKFIVRPKSHIGRSDHSADLPHACKMDRSSLICSHEDDSTDYSTNNDSGEMTKSEVVAFFNECSCSTLPRSIPCQEAKHVRFRADIDVMEVERFNNVAGHLWYSEAELLALERENLKISWQRTNDEELTDNEKQTVRGLELDVYPSAAQRRQETQYLAFESVMVEQDNQDRQNIYDPYAIAEEYQKNGARQCQLEAHTVGLKDFENIKTDYKQTYKLEAFPKGSAFSELACRYHSDKSCNIKQ